MERYKGNVDTLKIVDNDIRYKADSFVFNVAGAPEEVKQFSGISRPESWGRWSNAQLGSDVKIEYKEPLPEKFDLRSPPKLMAQTLISRFRCELEKVSKCSLWIMT